MSIDRPGMLSGARRRLLESRRVAYLATADAGGAAHVIPVCFVVDDAGVYITIDEKPKRVAARALKRLRNIAENPEVALVADRYDDHDWTRLGWVMYPWARRGARHGPRTCRRATPAAAAPALQAVGGDGPRRAARHRHTYRAGRKLGRSAFGQSVKSTIQKCDPGQT